MPTPVPRWFLDPWRRTASKPAGACRIVRDGGRTLRHGRRNKWTLIHLDTGSTAFPLSGQRLLLHAGMSVLMPPHGPWSEVLGAGPYIALQVVFDALVSPLQPEVLGRLGLPVAVAVPDLGGHRARWRELLSCYPTGFRAVDEWAALRARGWLDLLLADYLHAGFAAGAFAPAPATAPAWLEDLRALVRSRCPESSLTLAALARAAGYSASHLTHAFRAAYGESLTAYVQRCRMELAGKLAVQQPHLPIRELAALCGYTDRSAFSRRYAATWGEPPRPRGRR